MPRAITRCPSCREPVSPFAAGCAICGEDLEAARARLADRRVSLPRPTLPGSALGPAIGLDWVHILVAVVLALAISPIGLVLALYWAVQRHRAGDTAMVVAMVAVAAVAVAAMVGLWGQVL
jgi:hypothetical protein